MNLRLLPGADRGLLLDFHRQAPFALPNVSGGDDSLIAFLDWVNRAAMQARNHLAIEDIHRLIEGPRYTLLLELANTQPKSELPGRVIRDVVTAAVREQGSRVEAAIKWLEGLDSRWKPDEVFTVFDTGVFVNHARELVDISFSELLDTDDIVRLFLPMVVLDELDKLKQHGDNRTRWMARRTIAKLDQVLASATGVGMLKDTGVFPEPAVHVEIMLDPREHVRLPLPDDEIIDQALALHGLAGRKVTLVTFDYGQAMRARLAGLKVKRLLTPAEGDTMPNRHRN